MTSAPVSRSARASWHRWSRSLHSWISMLSLLLVLFFAVTGLTVNHPDWAGDPQARTVRGVLPARVTANGQIDFLAASQYLRDTHHVTGEVTDHGITAGQGRIAYQAPGYDAAVFFDITSREYTLTTTSYGLLAVANDLHKARHTSGLWSVVVDVSALVLAAVALTGLVLQLLIQHRRRTALALLAAGTVGGALLIWLGGA